MAERASLGRYGQAGKQGSRLLAALSRHVLQALCVEPVEVQPAREKTQTVLAARWLNGAQDIGTQHAEHAAEGPPESLVWQGDPKIHGLIES